MLEANNHGWTPNEILITLRSRTHIERVYSPMNEGNPKINNY